MSCLALLLAATLDAHANWRLVVVRERRRNIH